MKGDERIRAAVCASSDVLVYEVIGKPVVLHYANGWGYWVGTYLRGRSKALTDCHSTPDGALEELAARARIEHGIPRRGVPS